MEFVKSVKRGKKMVRCLPIFIMAAICSLGALLPGGPETAEQAASHLRPPEVSAHREAVPGFRAGLPATPENARPPMPSGAEIPEPVRAVTPRAADRRQCAPAGFPAVPVRIATAPPVRAGPAAVTPDSSRPVSLIQ